jgi:hypothetical protein
MVEMSQERRRELTNNLNLELTKEEYNAGWHFCCEWDGMLIGPGMPEFEECCSHRKSTCILQNTYNTKGDVRDKTKDQ